MALVDNISKVVTNGELVFIDTSSLDDCYKLHCFPTFHLLDPERLEAKEEALDDFLLALGNPNTRTIAEVTEEIRIRYNELGSIMSKMNVKASEKDKRRPNYQKNKAALERVSQKLELCQEGSRAKQFIPGNKSAYNALVEMIRSLSREMKLKQRPYKPLTKENGYYTEERLVASMYFASLCQRTPVLVSSDTYFPTLLGVTPLLMGSDVFMPHNDDFRQAIIKNPFALYLYFNGRFRQEFQDMQITYPNDFVPVRSCEETTERLRVELTEHWKRFSESRSHGYTIRER
jgi:hypothetical protein